MYKFDSFISYTSYLYYNVLTPTGSGVSQPNTPFYHFPTVAYLDWGPAGYPNPTFPMYPTLPIYTTMSSLLQVRVYRNPISPIYHFPTVAYLAWDPAGYPNPTFPMYPTLSSPLQDRGASKPFLSYRIASHPIVVYLEGSLPRKASMVFTTRVNRLAISVRKGVDR